jgi:hypothetical protein
MGCSARLNRFLTACLVRNTGVVGVVFNDDDCSLLTDYCSLLTAHCSLLTAHCSQLTAHCSPQLPTFAPNKVIKVCQR